MAPLVLSLSSLANTLYARAASPLKTIPSSVRSLNTVAVAVHVVSWIAQFVGHGKFEGRKPALLDNLVQALFLAPLFVWYEILFKLGFYKQLKGQVESGIEAEVAKLKFKGKGIEKGE